MTVMDIREEVLLPEEKQWLSVYETLSKDHLFTVEDLERLPDDGNRYELDDGVIIMNAAPLFGHQLVAENLGDLLRAQCHKLRTHRVLAPVGMRVGRYREYVPDIAVVPIEIVHSRPRNLTTPPDLVVEVVSASTSLYDRNLKKERYAEFGVPSYWIVDPQDDTPSLTVFELVGEKYQQVAEVEGETAYDAARPFEVRVVPAQLTEPYPEW